MKISFYKSLALLVAVALIAGCGGDDESAPSLKTYHITFSANGTEKVFDYDTDFYQSCGNCACNTLPPLAEDNNATISICQADNDWVVADDILGWNGDDIDFTDDSFPFSTFSYIDGGIEYYSDYASNQTGSKVSITKVETADPFFDKAVYKVSGTFNCKVAADGGADINITNGHFVVLFAED